MRKAEERGGKNEKRMSYSEQVGIIDREVEGFMKSSRSRGDRRRRGQL